jgi:hypothetical protein
MKKILLFTVAAATAMAFTGCSQSSELADTESNNTETTQKAISFDTYLSKTTRAGVAGAQNTETLKTNGFGVFAYYTGQNAYAKTTTPNFMYNTKVSVPTEPTGSTAFTYSPARYWPNNVGDKLSFFAYAPYVEVTAGTGLPADVKSGITALSNNAYTGAPTVTYKLADDKTQSVDLLWGAKMGTTNGVNTDLTRTKDNVGFTFKHTLAKFGGDNSCIKAILATDDDKAFDNKTTRVTISSIKITSSDIATTGTLDLTTGTWSSQDGDNKGTMTLDIPISAISEDIAETADKEIDGTAAGNLKGLLTTTTTNVLKEKTASYYFIPGTQPKFDVTVTYWVRTIDSSLSAGVTNVKQTIKKTIQFPNAFEANKKYNLILSIGLNTVKFSAEVSDWASDTEAVTTTVNVPEVL